MMFMVINGPRDERGRAPFVLFWMGNRGRRAQHFRAVPEDYLQRGDVRLVTSETEAKRLAWGQV